MLTFRTSTQVARYSLRDLQRSFRVPLTHARVLTERAFERLRHIMAGGKIPRDQVTRLYFLSIHPSNEVISAFSYEGEESYINLKCSDDTLVGVTLLRTKQFQFITDFMETYPGVSPIPIPYEGRVVQLAVTGSSESNLIECLDCVSFLNPVRNTYYFQFDSEGMDGTKLKQLALALTEEERETILYIYEERIGQQSCRPPSLRAGSWVAHSCCIARCDLRRRGIRGSLP